MDKVTRILTLFYRLSRGIKVERESFCSEFDINSRSFDRDIQDIRLFLEGLNTSTELAFDRRTGLYYLTNIFGR